MMDLLKPCKAFRTQHKNGNHFLAAYDYNAGRRNRYTVFVWRVGKTAKIIGRELTFGDTKSIIKNYPNGTDDGF